MRTGLFTTPAVSALILGTTWLASMIPVSRAYSSNHSSTLVTTIQLDSTTENFKSLFPVGGKGDDALWYMSKIVYSDTDDTSGPNMTIYSSTVFFNFSQSDYKVKEPACEAYYGGEKCSKCTLCADPSSNIPSDPWSLADGAVFFDCSGMQELRLCRGTTGKSNDQFEEGSICEENNKMIQHGSFRGIATCFEDYVSPAPSEAPSEAFIERKRRWSSGETRNDYITLSVVVSGILAWIAVL
ncbi:hypothetical protein MHU86_7210 [Fragilaria crotonensis]|nr:hypothetical protein MHU86_7210 [Fragilaria crotonensis]